MQPLTYVDIFVDMSHIQHLAWCNLMFSLRQESKESIIHQAVSNCHDSCQEKINYDLSGLSVIASVMSSSLGGR